MKSFNLSISQFLILILLTFFFFLLPAVAVASITDGTIDSNYKYAWGEKIGWINFGCSYCNVHITDSGLTGYAWSENYGWINLNPANSGVKNDGEGTLSGYAWGENLGWINFSGVTIDSEGRFHGIASGDISGQINFDCNQCQVKTDWRPRSVRPACNNSYDDDGDGKIDYPNDPGCDYLDDTDETDLTPAPSGGGGGGSVLSQVHALISLGNKEAACQIMKDWPHLFTQEEINEICPLPVSPPIVEEIKEIPEKIIEEIKKIPEIIKKIPEVFKPKPPEVAPEEVPIEELVPQEAPLVFQGKWRLLPSKPIKEFVLAPLPKKIRKLTEKFPELEKTFGKLGITKITDIKKLKAVKLILPGLTERIGLPTVKVEPGKFALPQGVPVAQLSPEVKEVIPSEIVFTRTGGELIDFNIALSVTEKGEVEQKIATISGKPLQLVVKPDKSVKSVKGYLVFKSKKLTTGLFQIPLSYLSASLFFTNPVFAQPQEKPVRVEEKLVLLEFEYTDPDGDGIYTAEILAPIVEGEYEIITVIDYEDPRLGKKEIRLITVVDPEGYVYEKIKNQELRITGAIVSLYWLNPETKQYQLWPAKEYQQENPQITDVTGKYAFLVPEGFYYLKVEAPGYLTFESKPFQIEEGQGIHLNIELKTKYWWLKIVDWKTIILVLVILFLAYNFYCDKIRERRLKKEAM